MALISCAQNFEDVMLWRALKHVKHGFYIDVGANDPNQDSVTKAFYENGWRGINIEPVPEWFEKLENERPRDINLQLAAGNNSGELPLYNFPDTGLSTLSKKIAETYSSEQSYKMIIAKVPVRTLTEICERYHASPVHFLKIDVEGTEKQVLEGMDFSKIRPWIVLAESTMPSTQIEDYQSWEPILLAADYRFVYFDGLNRFYVAKEHDEIADSFKAPPNCFDDFLLGDIQIFGWHIAAQTRQLQGALSEQQTINRSLQAELDTAKAKLEEMAGQSAAFRLRAEHISAQIVEKTEALASIQTALNEQQSQVDVLRNELKTCSSRIAELCQINSRLKSQSNQRVGEVQALREQLIQFRTSNQQLESERNADRRKIDEFANSSHHWRTVADGLNNQIQGVLKSKSWRMTEPLRQLMLFLRKPSLCLNRMKLVLVGFARRPARLHRSAQPNDLIASEEVASLETAQKQLDSAKPSPEIAENRVASSCLDFPQLTPWASHIYRKLEVATMGGALPSRISLSAQDVRVCTEAGEKDSTMGIISTGKPGILMFGPYLPLAPGRYNAIIFGKLIAVSNHDISFDVTHSGGTKTLAKGIIDGNCPKTSTGEEVIATMEFFVDDAVGDLEIRAVVGSESKVSIARYEVLPVN
jgi:FkbM family methyltransferase